MSGKGEQPRGDDLLTPFRSRGRFVRGLMRCANSCFAANGPSLSDARCPFGASASVGEFFSSGHGHVNWIIRELEFCESYCYSNEGALGEFGNPVLFGSK